MKIQKVKIKGYKIFEDVTINMNENINIFVGENDSGKTTILEAIAMALTGKVGGASIQSRITPDWFNNSIRTKYRDDIRNSRPATLPVIMVEIFFMDSGEDDVRISGYRGTNNSLKEDVPGVKVEIKFNNEYSNTYKLLLTEGKIDDIPIELYKMEFRSFASPDYYIPITSKKVACIDTTKKDYGAVLNKFVSSSISDYLTDAERTDLRLAYRGNRRDFTGSEAVKKLNEKLRAEHHFGDRSVSLNLREEEIDAWKSEMSLSIDDVPLEYSGFGTQNLIKSEMFLEQNEDVDILIIEEPENNLSYTNMAILVSKLSEGSKQIFISTHSSFVANKLGLNHLHLVSNHETHPFKKLSKDTYEYFLKLPGYNTLRLLLANQIILVEGPADELIVQRAYMDYYGKLPIEAGVDVMSVGGVAFKRYCELAKLIEKKIVVVTDNDRNVTGVIEKYSEYSTILKLCIENDDTLFTLEPSVLCANKETFKDFKEIIYKGTDKEAISYDGLLEFMRKNKTEWSMRVFLSKQKIKYPKYILEAIGVSVSE